MAQQSIESEEALKPTKTRKPRDNARGLVRERLRLGGDPIGHRLLEHR